MIPNDQPLRNQVIRLMLDYFFYKPEARHKLTVEEDNILLDIADNFETDGILDNTECEYLNRMYNK